MADTSQTSWVREQLTNQLPQIKSSWIQNAASYIKGRFKMIRNAMPTIPVELLICDANERPGLSAIALATAIIQRLPEAGISTAVNPDGSENKFLKLVRIMCEEIVKEVKTNSKVSFGIISGGITIQGVGNGPVGPIVVTGTNIRPTSGVGTAG